MDVLSSTFRVPRAPLCHRPAYVRPIFASGINPSAVATSFQAEGPTDTKGLYVSLGRSFC